MVAARQPLRLVHPLLHHHPVARLRDDEGVQVNLKPVRDRVVVYPRGQPAGPNELGTVDARPVGDGSELIGRAARLLPASAADVQAELGGTRIQAALEGAHDRGRDPRRVPVHPHDGAERLEPEWIAEPREELRRTIVVNHALGDGRAERRHALGQPLRHAPAVQRKISDAGSFHGSIVPPVRKRLCWTRGHRAWIQLLAADCGLTLNAATVDNLRVACQP